jgi:pantoate kinase
MEREVVKKALLEVVSELRKYFVGASLYYIAEEVAKRTGLDPDAVLELLREREVYSATNVWIYGKYMAFYRYVEDVLESSCICVLK